MKKQIQRLTVRTPRTVQIAFLIFLAIMMTPFFAYIASASPLDDYCSRQFEQSFRYKISPLAFKKCQTRFDFITDQWMTWNYTK